MLSNHKHSRSNAEALQTTRNKIQPSFLLQANGKTFRNGLSSHFITNNNATLYASPRVTFTSDRLRTATVRKHNCETLQEQPDGTTSLGPSAR